MRQRDEFIQGLVSVITPVYNCEKYIDRMLTSVFKQTYENIEIVIVDDNSTDHSAEIIERYMRKHFNINYYLQSKNMGAGYTRNKALELARGQYVAFLDSDDVWKPEKVEKQIQLMELKKASFCFTAIEMIDGNDRVIKGKRKVKQEIDYNFLLHNTMIPTSGVVIDRYVKGDFRMNIRRGGQDYATWLKLLRDGTIAYGIDEALVGYRIDGPSLSSNKLQSVKQIWEIQTKDEGIGKEKALVNIIRCCIKSLKKYWW